MRESVRNAEVYKPAGKVQQEPIFPVQHAGEVLDREAICYTMLGKHDMVDENNYPIVLDESEELLAEDREITFAKKVRVMGRAWRYFIRRASNGRLLNPIGIDEGRHNKQLHHAGRAESEYHEVNERVFMFYVNFLRSKNLAHLRNAEREAF